MTGVFDLQSLSEAMSIDMPVAHMTTNSWAATVHEIRKQERVHWFLGLRQAELFVRDKEQVIDANAYSERKYARRLNKLQRQLDTLNLKAELTPDEEDELEDLEDEIQQAKRNWNMSQPLIRDAEMEYQVAKAERDRILAEHPEALDLSFDELQKRCTAPALVEVHARYIAARVWSAQNGVPESVGSVLFELSPEEQELIMRREMQLRTGLEITQNVLEVARRVLALPEAQRDAVVQALNESPTDVPFYLYGE